MRPEGCEPDLLRALASMPFLNRLEMVAVTGWSRGAVYEAVEKLESGGLCASVLHATELLPQARRFHLTAAGAAQARRRRGHGPRRAGAPLARLGPVAAQPDGAPRRRGIDLRHSLRRLRHRVPRPLPLVPLHPPGRRHDPLPTGGPSASSGRDSPPTDRASPSASGGCATGRCPERCSSSLPTRCGSGTRAGRSRPPTHRRCWPSNAMRSRQERASRYGARPGSAHPSPCATPSTGRPPAAGCRWSRNPDGPTRPPTCPTGEPRRT